MKKGFVLVLLAVLFSAFAVFGAAEGEGIVVQSSCSIVQSGEYYLVYCYAQVHNNSDQVICLEQGRFDLQNGEQLLSTNRITQLWPHFINPGEDGYVFDIVSFEPNEDGVVVPQVTGINYQIDYMTVDPAYGNFELEVNASIEQEREDSKLTIICEVSNPTDMDAYDPAVTFGLYTAEGRLVYADGMTLQSVGIPAGGKTLVRFDVDEVFVAQWKSYNAVPAEVRVSATFRRDED